MPKLIVWIDDEIDVIYPVVRPLVSEGFEFVRIYKSTEALRDETVEIIRRADLLLLDLMIPFEGASDGLPGIEVLRRLRKINKITTPVVVFSVTPCELTWIERKQLGIADHVQKPVSPSELKARIMKAIAKS